MRLGYTYKLVELINKLYGGRARGLGTRGVISLHTDKRFYLQLCQEKFTPMLQLSMDVLMCVQDFQKETGCGQVGFLPLFSFGYHYMESRYHWMSAFLFSTLLCLLYYHSTAIWLMPRDNVYGNWPRSGEIDVMEARGRTLYDMIHLFFICLFYSFIVIKINSTRLQFIPFAEKLFTSLILIKLAYLWFRYS